MYICVWWGGSLPGPSLAQVMWQMHWGMPQHTAYSTAHRERAQRNKGSKVLHDKTALGRADGSQWVGMTRGQHSISGAAAEAECASIALNLIPCCCCVLLLCVVLLHPAAVMCCAALRCCVMLLCACVLVSAARLPPMTACPAPQAHALTRAGWWTTPAGEVRECCGWGPGKRGRC